MKKPIIGITLDLAQDSAKYSFAPLPWYALRRGYADCILATGGIPILLPYSDGIDIDSALDLINGLIIPGGDEDIHPKFYGQKIISDQVKTNDVRAKFELAITKKAINRNMPILGICNGLQVLNTVFGGTLIQHIPDVIKGDINHVQPAPKHVPTHLVTIKPDTLLAKLADHYETRVNSTHHQAIDKLGAGLIVSATASDGVIEAIESQDHKFVVGVQWHCEYLNSELDKNLFKRLVEDSLSGV